MAPPPAAVSTPPLEPGRHSWVRSVLLWVSLGLVAAAVVIAVFWPHGDLGRLVRRELASWGVFAAFTPPLLILDERVIRTSPSRLRQVVLLIVVGLAFILIHHMVSVLLGADASMLGAGFVYVLILVLGSALRHRRDLLRREVEQARLERLLAEARTRALQSQLQPHFLFNTLNGIRSQIADDPERARDMITALADLLRSALREESPTVSLEQDLELLQPYLKLQRMRFGERLRVETDIDDAARARAVPTLLLQPLVENAVRHGIEPSARGGTIKITAKALPDRTVLTVEDDGAGPGPGATTDGTGLRSARERLRVMFGDDATLDLTAREPSGACVRMEIPAR